MRYPAILLLLSACAAPELPPPPPEPAIVTDWPDAPPAVAPSTANHAPAAAAVQDYQKAEKDEARAVTKPAATADSIGAVREADKLARKAAADLVAQNGQPTAAAIARARRTLDDLIRALEAPQ